jgi:hypothetical protein
VDRRHFNFATVTTLGLLAVTAAVESNEHGNFVVYDLDAKRAVSTRASQLLI